jgi:hypothetical protein
VKIEKEYTVMLQEPSGLITNVWKGKSEADSYAWLESMEKKGILSGKTTLKSSKYLFNGKRVDLKKSVIWLNIILLIILIAKLVSM